MVILELQLKNVFNSFHMSAVTEEMYLQKNNRMCENANISFQRATRQCLDEVQNILEVIKHEEINSRSVMRFSKIIIGNKNVERSILLFFNYKGTLNN